MLLCQPQFLLAYLLHVELILKVMLGMVALLALGMLLKPRKGDWFIGMLAWIALEAVDYVFAPDRGLALLPLKALIIYYVIGLGISRSARTPKSAFSMIFLLCVGQYIWWAVFGLKNGAARWAPDFDNFDGYGPLMAMGVGPAYFYAMATKRKWRRRLALLTAALCVLGVVSAFARGAVVSVVATLGYIWLRSPRKGRTLGAILVGLIVAAIVASNIDGSTRGNDTESSFWQEMSTIFDHGGTRQDREILWSAALKIFRQHPVLGAGQLNFGVVAAETLQPEDLAGDYANNPKQLYSRALHNIYYQILSELGIVGVLIFASILIQFWRRNRALLRPEAASRWRAMGGVEDLTALARGLECGMVAYLCCGYFYNMLTVNNFYAFLIANTTLYSIVYGDRSRMPVPARRQPLAPVRSAVVR